METQTPLALRLRDQSITPASLKEASTATDFAKKHPELAGRLISALMVRNTGDLPGVTFVKRDGQMMKKQLVGVRLTESGGELTKITKKIDGNWVKDWTPSLAGLRKLNEVAALQIITPSTVVVDGEQRANPYVEIDAASRTPTVVYCRKIAVGMSSTGSLTATDTMIRLDINLYLLENIQAKMDRMKEQAGRLGEYGVREEKPKRDGRWVFMPIHAVGGMGLWVNMKAPEYAALMKDHSTRMKFLDRLAQSFAERNALKAHPAIPAQVYAENGTANVRMQGWTTDFSRSEIDKLRQMIEEDRLDEFEHGGTVIDVEATVVSDVTAEDIAAAHADVDEDIAAARAEAGEDAADQEGQEQGTDDLLADAASLMADLTELKGPEAAKLLAKACKITRLEEATGSELAAFVQAATKAMAE